MKNLYFFNKNKLDFVDFKKIKLKILSIGLSAFLTSGLIFFFIYYFVDVLINGNNNYSAIKAENKFLKTKINEVILQYKNLNKDLEYLVKQSKDLRITANLQPISDDERILGIGGGSVRNDIDFIISNNKDDFKKSLELIESIQKSFEFEKKNYFEISDGLKNNKKLFASIPAIKPCEGTLGEHGFGLRLHPILNINRMHEGIDIITDVGTKVKAAANGVVSFVGVKNGLGLTVEIDHGFGYKTIYGHLSNTLIKEGQIISRGTIIALSGNSGLSAGPHLHYEILHNGINRNPIEFFFDDSGIFNWF